MPTAHHLHGITEVDRDGGELLLADQELEEVAMLMGTSSVADNGFVGAAHSSSPGSHGELTRYPV